MVKDQEIIPNKEMLKKLEIFRLKKKGLRRQEKCPQISDLFSWEEG